MNPEVRMMLEGTYTVVAREFSNPEVAWDRFIEYVAAENSMYLAEQMPGFLGWLFEKERLKKGLPAAYDLKMHCSDYHDHLGDMYEEKILRAGLGSHPHLLLTPMAKAEGLAKKLIPETDEMFSIYSPAVGTGRLLMTAHRRAPNAALFGTDPDLRAVRVALTNLALLDIDGYILHADATIHEVDLASEAGRHNWRYANKWDSHIEKLISRIGPPGSPILTSLN